MNLCVGGLHPCAQHAVGFAMQIGFDLQNETLFSNNKPYLHFLKENLLALEECERLAVCSLLARS